MAVNIGKLFRFGNKKASKRPQQQQPQISVEINNESSDEEDGYIDPTQTCSTLPPGSMLPPGGQRQMIPNYPPPRPAGNSPNNERARDDYQDPWDAKKNKAAFDTPNKKKAENYSEPFDIINMPNEKKSSPNQPLASSDTYADPWDTQKAGNKTPTKPPRSNVLDIANKNNRKDDYSDPWDTQLTPSGASMKSLDDDTYTDPYDKNKQTSLDEEIANKPQKTKLKKEASDGADDDDIYDMPYEERVTIGIEDPKTNGSAPTEPYSPTRNKPLPPAHVEQSDYDAPWELKFKGLEEDFEKRFSKNVDLNISSKMLTSASVPQNKLPAPSQPRARLPSNTVRNVANPVQKPARGTPASVVDTPPMPKVVDEKYEVDPTIPLSNQGWFHGSIRREEAESLLKSMPNSSYLIRNSESSKQNYSLSLRNKGETMHLKISYTNQRYILGGNSRPYATIPEMVHYYSINKLNIRSAEHVTLAYPVLQEALYFTLEPEK